ncbi:MAG: LacI family transcriptional regulator [Paenibacillus sp.]|nr:LacI family transcriptional regulator [Paenibacillus sp.]
MNDPGKGTSGKPITLKDIAAKTGYTSNTVSRALKNKDDISLATRLKIQDIAKEMGYIGNAVASSLRSGKTKTIAIIVADVSNLHFSIIVKEIERAARERGYASFILNTNEEPESEKQAIMSALSKNVDGIIICPSQESTDNLDILHRSNTPFVLLGRHFGDESSDYVVSADEKGGYLATAHLIELNHRDILFLNAHCSISSARERLDGYRRAFNEAGIAIKKENIVEVSHLAGGCRKAVQEAIESQRRFTAIFAFNDLVAWEAIDTLNAYKLNVPHDVSVVGFDNIQSRFYFPFPLTSISSLKGKTARKTFEILIAKIEQPESTTRYREVIDTKLVLRGSTRAVQAQSY